MLKAAIAIVAVPASLIALTVSGVAQTGSSGSTEDKERRICRSMEETGKLAARRRVCLTKMEWDRVAEEQRRVGQAWITATDSCRDRANGGSLC